MAESVPMIGDFLPGFRRRLARPWSLATRLAIAFSVASLLLLLATAAFPYFALQYNLNREDDESLKEKVAVVADIVLRHEKTLTSDGTDELARASELQFSEPIYVRVMRVPSNEILIQSPGMAELLPTDLFDAPAFYPWDASHGPAFIDRHVKKHRSMRLLSVSLPGNAQASPLIIQVGLDRTPEAQLLEIYGNCLLALLAAGLVAAAIAGYAIAWRGLRPVRQMSAAVARIGSSTLHERFAVRDVPPELASLAAALNTMLSRLQDGFLRLSQFSSDIAHELRSPVNNVRGLVELTVSRADRPAAERTEQLTKALDECARLAKLIESLLFLARAENPQTQVQRQELNLRQELEALGEFYEPAAAEAGIALKLDVPESVSARADRLLIQRAISNLIENAIAHTPSGGTITLGARSEKGSAIVRVADTGAGIPAEHLARVFDRFHRVDPSRSKHTGGVGLGLAIVRSIAQMHGGKAEAAGRGGGGTEFTLVFPDKRGTVGEFAHPTQSFT